MTQLRSAFPTLSGSLVGIGQTIATATSLERRSSKSEMPYCVGRDWPDRRYTDDILA